MPAIDAGVVVVPDVFGTAQIPASEPLPIYLRFELVPSYLDTIERHKQNGEL